MDENALRQLIEQIEKEPDFDAALVRTAFDELADILPVGSDAEDFFDSLDGSDGVLSLLNRALPGWSVTLEGTAIQGHGNWTCSLRKSKSRDNDIFLGIGHGPRLSNALLGALLKALVLSRHYAT